VRQDYTRALLRRAVSDLISSDATCACAQVLCVVFVRVRFLAVAAPSSVFFLVSLVLVCAVRGWSVACVVCDACHAVGDLLHGGCRLHCFLANRHDFMNDDTNADAEATRTTTAGTSSLVRALPLWLTRPSQKKGKRKRATTTTTTTTTTTVAATTTATTATTNPQKRRRVSLAE